MTQQHRVTWGDFDLDMAGPDATYGFRVETMADGTNMGNPVRLVEVVKSLLTDGSLVERLGFDNREIPIRIRISAPTGAAGPALEAAERLLSLQTQGDEFPALSYTPPADNAAVCVFDVLDVRLEKDLADGWDTDEVLREYRYYLLTFSTHPFPRDADPTTEAALPIPATPGAEPVWVDIDTCGSTTGWSAEYSASSSPGVTLGSYLGDSWVQTSAFIDSAGDYLRLVRTGAVSIPAGHYLVVDVHSNYDLIHPSWLVHDGTAFRRPIAVQWFGGPEVAADDPSHRLYFNFGGLSTSTLKIAIDFTTAPFATVTNRVVNLAYTDTLGDTTTSTTRQQSRLVTIGGSAPTQAAVQHVSRDGSGLGDVLIYTSDDSVWDPPLRRRIDTSAPTTEDSALVSGGYHSLKATPATKILIPASELAAGSYDLLARLLVDDDEAELTWTAKMVTASGASSSPLSDLTISETVALPATPDDYEILVLNTRSLALPVRRVGDDQLVELTISATTGEPLGDVLMDEAWLFSRTHGALTWINGLGSMDWAEIQPVRLGEDALKHDAGPTATVTDDEVIALDGRFAVDDLCASVALHEWPPGERTIFTVQTGALTASSWITYYRRFHSHVEARRESA